MFMKYPNIQESNNQTKEKKVTIVKAFPLSSQLHSALKNEPKT